MRVMKHLHGWGGKPGGTTSKIYNKPRLMQITKQQRKIAMHQEHKNAISHNKLKQLKPRFGRLLLPPGWKWNGPILKGKCK